jgi:hypothetical protein
MKPEKSKSAFDGLIGEKKSISQDKKSSSKKHKKHHHKNKS